MTDWRGDAIDTAVYTAFGELRPSSTNHRYGYAASYGGYQAHDDFPYLHVGTRYYDPSTGRFLQRDPIGVWGGLNVYEYVRSGPVFSIDPDGLQWGGYSDKGPGPWGPPKKPKPKPKVSQSREEMEAELKKHRIIVEVCAAILGGVVGGGIGGALGGGMVGGAIGGGVGAGIGGGIGSLL